MTKRVKKISLVIADIALAAYLVVVFSAFHTPEDKSDVCTGVAVIIADGATHGFITPQEVITRIKNAGLYPKGKPLATINCRSIEEALLATPFIQTAQCYKTINGQVNISITQRTPVVRIKSDNNDDFYIDDKNCIMPITSFASDIIIATGDISRQYATTYVTPMAKTLLNNDFARNLFQQIIIDSDHSVELVPQVGNSIILLGQLPESNDPQEREQLIASYVQEKMNTLQKFYRYLPKVGWNKYSTINLEYDNQIVCKHRKK